MGGLLRETGGLRRDWQKVLDDSKWSTTKMPDELNYAVYLSYEYMPSYLKECFSYYALLPKGRPFNMDQVIGMWMSEGFIHGNSSDLEELGRNYYNELVSRNLIEPDKSYYDIWVCSMHDVVRSFAQYMTKDEAFVIQDGDNDILSKLSSQKFLRLSIKTNRTQSGELDWKSLQAQQSLRTLISTIQIKVNPGDSLVAFSHLRTLYIQYADVAVLVESLHQLKHLRYLALTNTDISILPRNIGKMKLLQFLELGGCENLVNLPDSIVKLNQLRLLVLPQASMIPRGFSGLTSMRRLIEFRAHMDGDWCSLDELGPLSQLTFLKLTQLENVSAASFAGNARLGEKMHLTNLVLVCTNRVCTTRLELGLVQEKEVFSEEEQQQINNVFNELCPPSCIEFLDIHGYFGQQLPSWMMSTSTMPFSNLISLKLHDLICCTQLPNGLCQLSYLQLLQVKRAPCIRRVGTGFMQAVSTPFPRLNQLILVGMVQWEEWEWEEQVQAMPRLEKLLLYNCKLRCVPPGLASNARALKVLCIQNIQHLSCLESFLSVVELQVLGSPDLERITNFTNLRKLTITNCTNLKALQSIPALDTLVLEDHTMEKLPEYMRDINPRHLQLFCRIWLLSSLAAGQSGLEWDKFSHVEHVKAYARGGNNPRKWYVVYTRRGNFTLHSNIGSSTVFEETLSACMADAQGFESVYKMKRNTFSYICSLVRIPFFEDMMASDHTYNDGRVMSLQDRVALALRMLSSGESPEIVGSSLGVQESTALVVTKVFVKAMWDRAMHHCSWPVSAKLEKVKSKFDKIHGLPNCCGVAHKTQILFRSKNHVHEQNYGVPMEAVVDADMKFTDVWLDCDLLNSFQDALLNGNKLNLSSGSELGEYIIGDAEYPLRPWLLTPYQLENGLSLSDTKMEFNRRHSAATSVAARALARLKDTWKCLQGEGWHPDNECELHWTIGTCCLLHNIVIEKEEEETQKDEDQEDGEYEVEGQEENYIRQVRRVVDEDAVAVRDALAQLMIKSLEEHVTEDKNKEEAP